MNTWRYCSSLYNDISTDADYSDEEVDRKLPVDPSFFEEPSGRQYDFPSFLGCKRIGQLMDVSTHIECSFYRLIKDTFLSYSRDEIERTKLREWLWSMYEPGKSVPTDVILLLQLHTMWIRLRIVKEKQKNGLRECPHGGSLDYSMNW